MGEDSTGRQSGRRVTVDEAARHLGLTVDAVRKRVQRGQLAHEKDTAGRVRIILDESETLQDEGPDNAGQATGAAGELADELRDRVHYLERQVEEEREARRRADTLLAQLMQRIPALETPRDERAPSETREDAPQGARPHPEEHGTTPIDVRGPGKLTVIMIATGVGLAAGAANPLLIVPRDNPLWLAAFLLWTLPPIFGLWLGRLVGSELASLISLIEARGRESAETDREGDVRSRVPWESESERVGPPSERGVEREFDRTDTREYYREDYRDGPGDRVEYVRRRLPFYAIMIGAATVLSSVSVIMFSSGTSLVQADTISLRAVFGVSIIQGILAVMFVLFAGSIGSGTVRQRAARATTGGGVSAEASAGKTSVLIGLIGTVGTVVAAVLAFLGVLFQVYGGGG